MLLVLFVFCVAALAVLFLRRQFIMAVLCGSLLPVAISISVHERASASGASMQFLLGYAVILLVGILSPSAKPLTVSVVTLSRRHSASLWAVLAVSVIGTIVHFLRAGLPLLSTNVEVERFSLGDSGLLGIPGRLYLFGLPLALALCLRSDVLRNVRVGGSAVSHAALACFVISRILSGFKSGLIEVLVSYAILIVLAGAGFDRKRLRRFLLGGTLAIIGVFAVGSQYGSYQRAGTFGALRVRVMEQSTDAAIAIMLPRDYKRYGPASPVQDLQYFGKKYFSIGAGAPFSFNQRVSADITGTPLRQSSFIVPVTTTAIAEAVYDHGLILGLVWLAIVALAINLTVRKARKCGVDARYLFCAATVLGCTSYVTKGGLIYAILNWTLIALLLSIVYVSVNMSARGVAGSTESVGV